MFGEDIATKGKPIRGYKLLLFTFVMIIALTTVTLITMDDMENNELQKIKDAQEKSQH